MTTNLTRRLWKGVWVRPLTPQRSHNRTRVSVTDSRTHRQHRQHTHHHHLCTCVQWAFRISCRPGFHYNTLCLWGWDHIIDIIISFFCELKYEKNARVTILSNHLNSEYQKGKETWFNIWFRAHNIPRPESKQLQIWQQIRAACRENREKLYLQ